jgi:hypothetical protein
MDLGLHVFRLAAACGNTIHSGIFPSLYDNGRAGAATFSCDAAGNITINSVAGMLVVVANAARMLIMLGGALAVIFIIVGGIYFVISAGDSGRLKQAKDIIQNSITGLVLIVVAYAVVTYIAAGF